MNKSQMIKLTPDEVMHISSDYIREGRLFESWKINEVTIEGKKATMDASMIRIYPPEANKKSFHLSIFLAEEMASQLMIIYCHIWAELPEKRKEAWMLESHSKSRRAVRQTEHIKVEMELQTIRKCNDTIFCIGSFRITDDQDGLIEFRQKGIVS